MFGNWGGGDDKRGAGDLQKENEVRKPLFSSALPHGTCSGHCAASTHTPHTISSRVSQDLKKEIEKLRAAKASGSSFFAGSADAHPAASPAKPKPGSPAHASSPQQQSKPKLVGNASPSKSPGAASSSSPTHLGVYHKITPGDVLHVTGLNVSDPRIPLCSPPSASPAAVGHAHVHHPAAPRLLLLLVR